ncbi:MAG: hypothetical protein WC756_00510 [Taibaiella sp.]|jgi:hypothetical protein
MQNLFALLLLTSIVFLVIGFFNPSASLFWYKSQRTKKKSTLVYGGFIILFFILTGTSSDTTKMENKLVERAYLSKQEVIAEVPEITQEQKDSLIKIEREAQAEEIKKNTISASDLTATYEANEVAADDNFKGKTFYVSGIVTDIKKDILDDIYVILKGDDMFRDVQCFFENKEIAAQMQKGMKVTFKGRCNGLMINVLMRDCEFVQ